MGYTGHMKYRVVETWFEGGNGPITSVTSSMTSKAAVFRRCVEWLDEHTSDGLHQREQHGKLTNWDGEKRLELKAPNGLSFVVTRNQATKKDDSQTEYLSDDEDSHLCDPSDAWDAQEDIDPWDPSEQYDT